MKLLYVSPFNNPKNEFTNVQMEGLRSNAERISDVRRALLRDWDVPRGEKAVVLNWYEDRVFNSKSYLLNTMVAVLFLLAIRLRVGRIIWFRHNIMPHKYSESGRLCYVALKKLMTVVSDAVVSMRAHPDFESMIVPHPVYPVKSTINEASARTVDLLWFGQVRRNKNIPWLLANLQGANKSLVVAGECDDQGLRQEILDGANFYGVKLQWVERFLSQAELEVMLGRAKYVVLTHDENTAVFSGSFIHAASYGANIVMKESSFARFAAQTYSFCSLIDENRGIDLEHYSYVEPGKVAAEVLLKNGPAAVSAAWTRVFNQIGCSHKANPK